MENEHSREILLTYFIICPIPDLWPAETQARNNNRRRSLTDLRTLPHAPTSIMYRLQSDPSLLRAVLRSAYLEALHSLALLASVSQGQVGLTKAIPCLPCTDRSRCQLGSTRNSGPAVHPSHSTAQLYSCPEFSDLGRNCACRSTVPGPMHVYNGQEHGIASALLFYHRAGNLLKHAFHHKFQTQTRDGDQTCAPETWSLNQKLQVNPNILGWGQFCKSVRSAEFRRGFHLGPFRSGLSYRRWLIFSLSSERRRK
jgi:hypothetical protein